MLSFLPKSYAFMSQHMRRLSQSAKLLHLLPEGEIQLPMDSMQHKSAISTCDQFATPVSYLARADPCDGCVARSTPTDDDDESCDRVLQFLNPPVTVPDIDASNHDNEDIPGQCVSYKSNSIQ